MCWIAGLEGKQCVVERSRINERLTARAQARLIETHGIRIKGKVKPFSEGTELSS